ncbi:MAG: PaP73 [Marmoricola sp.]|nr:PaP73 [Marmoricola sp.]
MVIATVVNAVTGDNRTEAEKVRDAAIQTWKDAQAQSAFWKDAELTARIAAIEAVFTEPPDSGTVNYDLGKGYKLKAVFRENYKLEKGDPLEQALTKIEATGERGKLIAERVIRWKPELSKTEYDQMPDELRSILDTVLTVEPGTPSLELVEPATQGEPKRRRK